MSVETYKRIIAACFPDLGVKTCEYATEGWDSIAVVVNGELIFRFPKRPEVEPQYRMEAALLAALVGRISLPIPQFAHVWEGAAPYEHVFVGYRMLAGEQLRCGALAALDQERLAARLGRFITELHAVPAELAVRASVAGRDAEEWRQGGLEQYATIQARVFPLLDAPLRDRVAQRWTAFFDDGANFQFQTVLVHGDLTGDHILIDPASGSLTGVIDWGDAMIGDPAFDFAGLLDSYGEPFTRRVLGHYGGQIDRTFLRRAAFYRDAMRFNDVLYGLRTGLREYVEEGLEGIRWWYR